MVSHILSCQNACTHVYFCCKFVEVDLKLKKAFFYKNLPLQPSIKWLTASHMTFVVLFQSTDSGEYHYLRVPTANVYVKVFLLLTKWMKIFAVIIIFYYKYKIITYLLAEIVINESGFQSQVAWRVYRIAVIRRRLHWSLVHSKQIKLCVVTLVQE